MDDELYGMLTRLIALTPDGDAPINALVRVTCAGALSLPPLIHEGAPADEPAVGELAEQFATDVSSLTAQQRASFAEVLGKKAFGVMALIFIADFVPRVQAGLAALGLPPVDAPTEFDHTTNPIDLVLNEFVGMVGARRALDPVMTEVIRLRGAVQHGCRLCKSRRESGALDAGGSESLYEDIERYESSTLVDDRQKAALRYVDALIWTPSSIGVDVAAGVRARFTDAEALEITLDVMRNAANKILVAFGADAPKVEEGTELFELGIDGQPVYA
jgi:alkylhydroperoxidase family enzyme